MRTLFLSMLLGSVAMLGAVAAGCGDDSETASQTVEPTARATAEGLPEEPTDEATGEPTAAEMLEASPELESYFEELDAAEDAFRVEQDAVSEELNAITNATIGEVPDILRRGQRSYDTLVSALEDMDPPDEVEEAHNQVIVGFMGASQWLEDNFGDVEAATSLDDLGTLFTTAEYQSVSAELDGTCDALQTIADNHGIVVDLSCNT